MKKQFWLTNTVLTCVLLCFLSSCEKVAIGTDDDEQKTTTTSVAKGTLLVKAAATSASLDDESAVVSYPVQVFVFDSDDVCVSVETISSEEESLELRLSDGVYDIYAVAGADADKYVVPSASEATPETLITLKDGNSHGDLMSSYNSVVVDEGESNTLTLGLERKVIMIDDVAFEGMPVGTTSATVTISPLRESLRIDGRYGESTCANTFELERLTGLQTWKNPEPIYMLESSAKPTIKLSFTADGETTSYSYTCSQQLEANHKVNISGQYSDGGMVFQGSIQGAIWDDPIDILFDFNQDETPSTDTSTELVGNAPAEGTLYKGCYVLRSYNAGNSTIVWLTTPTEANEISYSKSQKGKDNVLFQEAISTAVDKALAGVSVANIDGWRLPTSDELEYLTENYETINANIEQLNASGAETTVTIFDDKVGAYNCGYYYDDEDGNVYVYTLVTGEVEKEPNPNRASYKVRGFLSLKFEE